MFKPSGLAFCIFALSCKQWRWQQVSNFPWFMPFSQKIMFPSLNDNENDNETISISWQNVLRWWMAQMRKDSWDDSLPLNIITCLLRFFAAMHNLLQRSIAFINPGSSRALLHLQVRFDDLYPQMKIAKAKALDHVDALLEWMKGMEHVAVRADFFQQTEFKACFWAWEWMVQLWFAVALAGIIPYHTVGSAARESAGQSKMLQTLKWRCKKTFRMQFFQGMRMMQSGYAVKRYSELPKTITLTKDRIFSRFCRSLKWMGFVEWGFLAALSPGCLASLLTWPLSDSLGQDFPRWLSASVDSAPVEVWPVGWEVPWTHLTSQEDMFDQLGRGQKTRDSIVTIGSKLIVQSTGDQKFVKTLRFPSVKLPKSDHHWLRGQPPGSMDMRKGRSCRVATMKGFDQLLAWRGPASVLRRDWCPERSGAARPK